MAARVNWSKYDPLILAGSMPLKEIAALVGCSHTAVFKRRQRLADLKAEAAEAGTRAEAYGRDAEKDAANAPKRKKTESAEDYDGIFAAVNVKTKKARIMLASEAADEGAGEVCVFVNFEHKTAGSKIERAAAAAVMGAVNAGLQVPIVVDMTNDGRARRNWIRFIAESRTRPR